MQIPGVHIETLHNPVRYTYAQIEKACAIAQMLNRGKLVLVEPPRVLIPRCAGREGVRQRDRGSGSGGDFITCGSRGRLRPMAVTMRTCPRRR